jgi:hypothetical protein
VTTSREQRYSSAPLNGDFRNLICETHGMLFQDELHQVIDTLLADGNRPAVLEFLVRLQHGLDLDHAHAGVPDPEGVAPSTVAAIAELRGLLDADDGVTNEDLFAYLWEDEELGPELIALAARGV